MLEGKFATIVRTLYDLNILRSHFFCENFVLEKPAPKSGRYHSNLAVDDDSTARINGTLDTNWSDANQVPGRNFSPFVPARPCADNHAAIYAS